MGTRPSNYGDLEQYLGFRVEDFTDVGRSSVYDQTLMDNQAQDPNVEANSINKNPNLFADAMGAQLIPLQRGSQQNTVFLPGGQREISAKSNMNGMGQSPNSAASDTSVKSREKYIEQKTLRKLAQNREAARKSRLRKKAYVQQLENSRMKLSQLEQELEQARRRGVYISNAGDQSHGRTRNGLLPFDTEYARWTEEHKRHINELRAALHSNADEKELRTRVDNVTRHFNVVFGLKGTAAKVDVFHILSGMWKMPAESFFMWTGGFRPSELLEILTSHLEHLTEQQATAICNLQQTSHQVEVSLSQGMEALQQSIAQTVANSSPVGSSGDVDNYMDQMVMAMGKLGTLEGFLHQADNLRQQTLQQMHYVLTVRQSAHALILTNDYFLRLKTLSSLWLVKPHE